MSIAQSLLAEFEAQAPVTRKFLERLPADKLTWKPHAKSMTAGQLAQHLASIPGGVVRVVQTDRMQPPDFNFPQPASVEEVLKSFDEGVAAVQELLPTYDDAFLHGTWRMFANGREVMAVPREQFLRNILLNHWYQHRGQFSVYLRILDVPVPSTWGPSADESVPFQRDLQPA